MVEYAMFGGSFDPIHLGHLHLIHNVYEKTRYKKIILVPLFANKLKEGYKNSASIDRLNMISLALEDYRKMYPEDKDLEIIVETCELDRGGFSYTLETVDYIYKKYNIDNKLGLLMGDDLVPSLSKWYKFDILKEKVKFIICRRNNDNLEIKNLNYEIVNNVIFEDASSTIRALIKENKEISSLVSKGVLNYVESHELYRS
ncbi:MAG: nicotinate (nicotinamide) nucleotide adenylyltransferase [Sphaerochaetaceae bacterium]|nr:nicotinate (nicotinamide) nucleotide adenylyltransferase [Sphaerochaetaceae bacterium]